MKKYVMLLFLLPCLIIAMDENVGTIDKNSDEYTANLNAFNRLTEEEKCRIYIITHGGTTNKEKAFQAIYQFAQLTSEELEKKGLLTLPKEEFEKKFIEQKLKNVKK